MDNYPEYQEPSNNTSSVRGMTPGIDQTRQLLPPVRPPLPLEVIEVQSESQGSYSETNE